MNGLILFVGMMIPTAIGITIFSLWLFSDNKKKPTFPEVSSEQ